MTASWRTTALAVAKAGVRIGALLAAATGQPTWVAVVGVLLGEVAAVVQGALTRDDKVSDEQAGAGQVVR